MGVALYRKHRSKTLDEVVGQEHITDTLKNALKTGAISHAYLFTGPRGVGKTSIARILAHEINKIDYNDESIHLDIIEIDAASNRRIDEIRDLRDKVNIAPTSAKYKVYIIDEVHMLTREAFNALLKTLEEPPEHVVFILATTEAHKVPETIISRTQRFTFKPIAEEGALEHLKNISKKENIKISDEALKLVIEHSNGSFRDSISMLDQLSGMENKNVTEQEVKLLLGLPDQKIIIELINQTFNGDHKGIFKSIQTLREQGADSANVAKSISSEIRNMIANDKLPINTSLGIKLLKELLPLTYGSDQFLNIELCLIDLNPHEYTKPQFDQPKIKEDKIEKLTEESKSEPLRNSSATKESKEDENKKPEVLKDKTTKNHKFTEDNWQKLLDDIKGKHNTLYGILRMAKVSQEDGKIVLVFKFGFHKKRIESGENKKIINQYLNEYFGTNETKLLVKDKLIDSQKMKPNKLENEDISNISNIFKGAELLDS